MLFNPSFFINSALLGVGLAMDAFTVSVANGLAAPNMSRARRAAIPATFALFQFMMPVIGWCCVRAIADAFAAFSRAIPWIAMALLGFIGIKMVIEGLPGRGDPADGTVASDAGLSGSAASFAALLAMQGVAMLFRVYLSRTVGAAGLGLLQLILTVGGLALTVGVSGARVTAMYLCAEELGQRRSRGVGRVLQACTSYCLCAGCLAGLTLILGADYIALRWIGDARAASGIRLLGLFLPACVIFVRERQRTD